VKLGGGIFGGGRREPDRRHFHSIGSEVTLRRSARHALGNGSAVGFRAGTWYLQRGKKSVDYEPPDGSAGAARVDDSRASNENRLRQ